MKHIRASIRSMSIQAAIIVGVFAVMALIKGQAELILPFIAGGFVYSVCWLSSGYKLLASDKVTPDKAKKSLKLNFQVRLLVIFITLLAAMKAGEPFFWAAVAGLFCMFVLMIANAMVCSWRDGR